MCHLFLVKVVSLANLTKRASSPKMVAFIDPIFQQMMVFIDQLLVYLCLISECFQTLMSLKDS